MVMAKSSAGKQPSRRAPDEAEREAIGDARRRYQELPARPDLESERRPDGALHVHTAHDDDQGGAYQVQAAFGSRSAQFVSDGIVALANVVGVESDRLGSATALVAAVEPRNELESALAQQMAVTHSLAMSMASRASKAGHLDAMNAYANLATKFGRTFTAQIDALTKLRTGGKQVVEHRHVYVSNGGQAIVAGEFHHHAGGGNSIIPGQPHACVAPLPGPDPIGQTVPIPSGEGEEALSDARRSQGKRRAEGE
jgi:hypothetical protein